MSLSVNEGNGKKSESVKENGAIVRGRRNERGNGRGKGSANGKGTGTKIVIVGPEKENETETGRGTEAAKGALTAADPGKQIEHNVKGFKQKYGEQLGDKLK